MRSAPTSAPLPAQHSGPRPNGVPPPASYPPDHSATNGVPGGQPQPAQGLTIDYRAALRDYEGSLQSGNVNLQMEVASSDFMSSFALWHAPFRRHIAAEVFAIGFRA